MHSHLFIFTGTILTTMLYTQAGSAKYGDLLSGDEPCALESAQKKSTSPPPSISEKIEEDSFSLTPPSPSPQKPVLTLTTPKKKKKKSSSPFSSLENLFTKSSSGSSLSIQSPAPSLPEQSISPLDNKSTQLNISPTQKAAQLLNKAELLKITNPQEATKLFKQALTLFENSDDSNAYYCAGYLYEHGLGTELSIIQAITWYEKALSIGSLSAKINLNLLYHNFDGKLYEQEFNHLQQKVTSSSHVEAIDLFWYAKFLHYGWAGRRNRNIESALQFYEKAGTLGHAPAYIDAGFYCQQNSKPLKAFSLYREAWKLKKNSKNNTDSVKPQENIKKLYMVLKDKNNKTFDDYEALAQIAESEILNDQSSRIQAIEWRQKANEIPVIQTQPSSPKPLERRKFTSQTLPRKISAFLKNSSLTRE